MKKLLTFALSVLFVLSVTNLFSQNAYIKVGGGYGLNLASQYIYNNGVSPANDYKYGSFGSGINFHGGFGIGVHPNIALELAGSYTLGNKYEYSSGTTIVYNKKQYASTISIMPSVIVKTNLENMTPYSRFGIIIGIPTKNYEETATGTGAPTGTFKEKETGGMALGFQGAFGINFKASKQIGIYTEIFGIGMNYAPGQIENTETYTGGTIIPVRTYEETWTPATGDNKAGKPRYSFSSFGLNVGLTYTFGK
jgi:hypothetical protein